MQFFIRRLGAAFSALVLIAGLGSFACAADSGASFPPLEQWKSAVVAGNTALLKSMYSSNPPARIATITGASSSPDVEASFWTGLKARQIKLDVTQSTSPQPGVQQVVFEVEVHSGTAAKDHVVWVTEGQLWQEQNGSWKILATKRGDPAKLQQPLSTDKVIYAPGIDAHEEIKQAVAQAAKQHKNVLIVFGANWCYDCHVLDLAFHRPDLTSVLQKNYEVVHVDVGEGDKNQDIMQQYGVPMKKGIPALAVLDSHGKLLYSQQGGEFEKARSLAPEDLLTFLNKWKPAA
ncbi:MAG TPA: thioredoxin family protein [Verrucomicrobiae bacterium]|jgi:thioredoxin 1|nr:thioredoxin family protein [Verrucomicrobiae bacterium]